jgi:hypothetical protein
MNNNKPDISDSEKFIQEYNILLQKVKERFKVKDASWINISQPKASRVLNAKQFDIITLIKMASFAGYDVELFFKKRIEY